MTNPATAPEPADIAELTEILDRMVNFSNNEQRARYILCSDWLMERGAIIAEQSTQALAQLRLRNAAETLPT